MMKQKRNFSFNATTHNFWSVYECIQKYYPLGIRGHYPSLYYEYPGIKKIEGFISENIHQEKVLQKRWLNFTQKIEKILGKKVENTSHSQAPCFSANLILDRKTHKNLVKEKKIHFTQSLLGPFFTLFGVDETRILDVEEQGGYEIGYAALNVLTASPHKEFQSDFLLIKSLIEEQFEGSRFVPFGICSTFLEGLQIKDKDTGSVFQALFNHYLYEYPPKHIRGDIYYAYSEWLKK